MAEVTAWLHVDTSESETGDLLLEQSKNSYHQPLLTLAWTKIS